MKTLFLITFQALLFNLYAQDTLSPTLVCRQGYFTIHLNSKSSVTINATEFDQGSYDNVTPKDKLKFYFNGDPTKTSISVGCEEYQLVASMGSSRELYYQMYVEDEAGNKDFCNVIVELLDPYSNCGDKSLNITHTPTDRLNCSFAVDLIPDIGNKIFTKSGVTLSYPFCTPNSLKFFTSIPHRNNDHLNGVTTADITILKKHILGQVKITDPFKLIAADVTNSKSLSGADIIEIRKLILGYYSEFPLVESWTFVPSDYIFPDDTQPFDAPRSARWSSDSSCSSLIKFNCIKMADLNWDKLKGEGTTRTPQVSILRSEISKSEDYIELNLKMDEAKSIAGMQFCLEFDPNDYSFESYNSDLLSLDEFNFNIQPGQIKFSWDHDNGIFMQTGKTILNLKFKHLSNKISAFGFNESVMISELIETDGRTTSIELKLLPSNIGAPLVSFYPNPLSGGAYIKIHNLQYETAQFKLYDINYNLVHNQILDLNSGANTILFNSRNLVNGLYYYRIETNTNEVNGKLVILND
ncbi:MAG: T9SS type A sorting domain-containing protein [Saprospiraceae bacterium]